MSYASNEYVQIEDPAMVTNYTFLVVIYNKFLKNGSVNSESGPVSLENSVAILGSDVLHTAREVFPSMGENHVYGWVWVLIGALYWWIARFDPQVTSNIYGFQPAYERFAFFA